MVSSVFFDPIRLDKLTSCQVFHRGIAQKTKDQRSTEALSREMPIKLIRVSFEELTHQYPIEPIARSVALIRFDWPMN